MATTVFWIPGPWAGRLGIVPRPRGGEWLDDELQAWRDAGIDIVISLLEPEEETDLALTQESVFAPRHGLEFHSFPIPDRGVPRSGPSTGQLVDRIVDALQAGKTVVLHCRQGLGRSPLIAAAVLMSSGSTPEAALELVRRGRGLDVPETAEQRRWLADFAASVVQRPTRPRHTAIAED